MKRQEEQSLSFQQLTASGTGSESNTSPASPFDPGRLAGIAPIRRLPGRNRTKADILVYRLEGEEIALKDYRGRSLAVRQTLGRLLIRREAAAYRAAAGAPGLPEFLGRVGPLALALRWVEGIPLASLAGEPLDDALFDRVGAILDGLHARGIVLGDLHHRDVLVSADGSVRLVDLATAVVLGNRPGFLRRALFRRLKDQDLVALARMRARWTGRDVAAAVAAVGRSAAVWHERGRRVKRLLDALRRRPRGG